MRYERAFNVWPLPSYLRKHIQPGQWVTAGENGPKGMYLGQTAGGTDVVAWPQGKGSSVTARAKLLRQYAISKEKT
jgi:hypothetical protein